VVAVEPLAEMREQLTRAVPGAELVDATAEQMPLEAASADAVTVGQAFHWFDETAAAAEIVRVLRPGGALALLWNMRELADPLQARINEVLERYRHDTPSEHHRPWRAHLDTGPELGPVELRAFPWSEPYTADRLVDRISSVSFVARLSSDERAPLLDDLRETVAGMPAPFAFSYRTDVLVYRRL
jgi:SAM-dependent methyltransferase